MSAPTIGEMRQRLSIEAPIDAADDSSAMTRSYAPLGEIWAKLAPLSGDAQFIAGRQEQAIEWVAQIRWRADVTCEMRLVVGARRLRVKSAYDPDGRRRFLICRCEEIA